MAVFQGLLLSVLGLGLLGVTYQSLERGWLPYGPSGVRRRIEVQRQAQPVAYWAVFTGYTLFALWLLWLGVGILAGTAESLPLS